MAQTGCHWEGNTLVLAVRVQPRAARDEIVGPLGDALKIRITAPPVEGRANAHLLRFLAEVFQVPQSRITLVSGGSGRSKRLRIDDPIALPAAVAAVVGNRTR